MKELKKVAPFLNVRFYQILSEKYGQQGKNAYFVGFHLYAFRKGIRCAQRAVSKNLPLNYDSYQLCREAVGRTPEAKKCPDKKGKSTMDMQEGSYISSNYYCSISETMREYGAPLELEEMYCRNVDRIMMYSYYPELGLGYEVTETFCSSDHCEHHFRSQEISPDMRRTQRTEDAPPLAYLTWSAYASIAETVISIFGEPGKDISRQVKQDIIREFGPDIWQQLEQYKNMNLDSFYRV